MEQISSPHDKLFKEVLSRQDAAVDFVVHYLPKDIASLLNVDSLKISKDTFVDKELASHLSDLLYHVDLQEKGSVCVYLLFEHKSFIEPLICLHLLRYMTRIWEQWLKTGKGRPLPAIIPCVVYHGRETWTVGSEFHDLFDHPGALDHVVPSFEYLLCDLSRYSDEEIKGAVVLRVAFLLLKHIFSKDLPEKFPGILGLLKDLLNKRNGLEYLETVLRYVASGSDQISREAIEESVRQVFEGQGGDIMPTIAEQLIEQGKQQGMQQGIQQGMQQGIQQGIQQGSLKLLCLQIAKRFKTSYDSVYPIFRGLRVEDIEELGERFLEAESLEEIHEWAEEKRLARMQ